MDSASPLRGGPDVFAGFTSAVTPPGRENPGMFAGFTSAAAPSEDSAEDSLARRFADQCARFWDNIRNRQRTKSYAMGSSAEGGSNPYEKFWFRANLGHQVYDCGNCIHMSGTDREPVTRDQIERMVKAGISRKNPPWETIYMYNHKGLPDLKMAHAVQSVIDDMRAKGTIPADCRISCCLDPSKYPPTSKMFDKMLRNLFRQAAQPGVSGERPGFMAHQRPGFQAAPV